MIGLWSIAEVRGRAVFSVWFGRRPTRERFEPSDVRGEATDVHAARLQAFGAFSRARGVTRWAEIDPLFAVADDRVARGIDPPFPGDRRRAVAEVAPRELPAELIEILDLSPPFTLERARAAYKARALELHPDRGGSHEDMLALNQAFEAVRARLEPTASPPTRSTARSAARPRRRP